MRNYYIWMLSACLVLFLSLSNESFADSAEMSDIRLRDYPNFAKEWTFVTVRYRKDSGEMRVTYANPLAWENLQNGVSEYPNGSVFAKISVKTNIDPSFPSSMVPSGARRIQFMVRDKAKYKDTYGWGYALFQSDGSLFPGDMQAKAMACAACHQIVADRGQVFSEPMPLFHMNPAQRDHSQTWIQRIKFQTITVASLPKVIREQIGSGVKRVRSMQGALTENLFFGTLDEVRPVLSQEVLRSNKPAILLSKDRKQYSLVVPWSKLNSNAQEGKAPVCGKDSEKALVGFHTVPNKENPLFRVEYCDELIAI